MNNMNNTKKTYLLSALSLLLCISMLIGSTFAWFTDSVSSADNKIQSGTLSLDVELLDKATGKWNSLKNTQEPIFNYDKWEPGYVDTKVLKVENEGNLALKWVTKFYSEQQLSILADAIDVYVCHSDTEIGYPADRNLEGYTPVGTLRNFINSIDETTKGTLEPDQVSYLGLALKMREEAGNEYQGLSLGGAFDIRFYAAQHTFEYDSFDDEYDKYAEFDALANTSTTATATDTLAAGADSLDFDLSGNGHRIAKVIIPASAIADPEQPVTVTFESIAPSQEAIIDENTKAYAFDINVTNLKDDLADDQLVTVVVTAPNALAAMKAYHNGTLIEDAIYDEVEGTITFKTASFSPYDFTYQEKEVTTLEELRAAVKESNVEIKLTADLTIDLTAGSTDRSEDHSMTTGGGDKYYNAVNIIGENVAVNLNGHKITVKCSNAHDGNQDVGALFFVKESGSLNIIDRAGNGFIKMESSIYMVWAPYASPSYVDIYSGAFIADSYAGDPIGTPVDSNGNYDPVNGTMKNENSNRALIYAGFGGNINIRGGYFLYNNTPNDTKDRNNGAFNAKDFYEEDTPLITIHDGVMLINKEYRQNPANTSQPHGSYDNYSVKLAKDREVVEVNKSKTIDGETYTTWYEVVANLSSITATVKDNVYELDHEFTADDFNVYAITENGGGGKITNFTVSVNSSNGIATITYTSDSGKTLTTICSVSKMNLTLLDEDRIKAPISIVTGGNGSYFRPYEYAEAPFFGTGNFSVSGWAHLVNGAYTYDYFANNNLTYNAPNGETVTGFNNKLEFTGTGNNRTGKYADGFYGLTINNAKPYTTLGINNVVGCLEDAPQLKGFGVYINDNRTTLKWAAPAAVYTEGGMFDHYGWNNGHSVLEINCADFEPGKSYDIHWVLVFEDGLVPMADWKVNMAAASASDAVFTDTDKPNANVIVMAGQSNMFGPAPLTQKIIDAYKDVNFSNVFIKYANINFDVAPDGSIPGSLSTVFSNSDFQKYEVGIGAQGNTYFGPELALAYQLATNRAFAGQQWYIVKYAPAGTALGSQWTSNCSLDGKNTTLTNDMLNYVQTAIDSLSDDFDVHVRSFMWMQGESDAATEVSANNYGNLEKTLVSRVRDTFAAYATRPAGNIAGSGISFINAGIADNPDKLGVAQGGPNDWIYASTVNKGKVENCQQWCSLPAMAAPNFTPTSGPLAGVQFQANAPSMPNTAGGNIINSIFIDTSHLLSKAAAHSLDSSHALYEDYGNVGDNTDWAHYSAGSMEALGQLYGSCLQYMIQQNG